jgi:death-on-curing protein
MHSVVSNHAFIDGNKRVGLTCALAFLYLNGIRTEPFDEGDAYDLTVAVASGSLDDVSDLAARLKDLLP